jgi:hypothetical protein
MVILKRLVLTCAALGLMQIMSPGQLIQPVHAQQEPDQAQCVEGDGWLECRAAAGDHLAMYRIGRTEYEQARENGDFTEALQSGRKLAATGDKNGKRLLKMVHLQLSWGKHKDNVQAYVWLVEDEQAGIDYLDKLIRNLADKMTPEQLAQAKELAGQ